MTTAVLRIAKASVGEGTGIKRPRRGASKQSSGPFPTKAYASLFLIERDRVIGRAGADLCWFCRGRASGTRVRAAWFTLHRRGC